MMIAEPTTCHAKNKICIRGYFAQETNVKYIRRKFGLIITIAALLMTFYFNYGIVKIRFARSPLPFEYLILEFSLDSNTKGLQYLYITEVICSLVTLGWL